MTTKKGLEVTFKFPNAKTEMSVLNYKKFNF